MIFETSSSSSSSSYLCSPSVVPVPVIRSARPRQTGPDSQPATHNPLSNLIAALRNRICLAPPASSVLLQTLCAGGQVAVMGRADYSKVTLQFAHQ